MRQKYFLVSLQFILQYIYIFLSIILGFLSISCTLPVKPASSYISLASLYKFYDFTPNLEIIIDGVHNLEIRTRVTVFVAENLQYNDLYKSGHALSLINQLKLSGFFSNVYSQLYIRGNQRIIKIHVQVNPIVKQVVIQDGSKSLIPSDYISYVFKQQLGYPRSFSLLSIALQVIYKWYSLKGYKWVRVQLLDTMSHPNIIYIVISEGKISHISLVANVEQQYFLDISYIFDIHQILQVCGLSLYEAIRIDRIEQGIILLRDHHIVSDCSYYIETQESLPNLLTIRLKFKLLRPNFVRIFARCYLLSKDFNRFLKLLHKKYIYWLDPYYNISCNQYGETILNPIIYSSDPYTNILSNRYSMQSIILLNSYLHKNMDLIIQNCFNYMRMSREFIRDHRPSLLYFNFQPLWCTCSWNYYPSLSKTAIRNSYSYLQICLQHQASSYSLMTSRILPFYQYWFFFRQIYAFHLFIMSKEFNLQTIIQVMTNWYIVLNWNLQQVFQEIVFNIDSWTFTKLSMQSIYHAVVICWNCTYNLNSNYRLYNMKEVFKFDYICLLPVCITDIWLSFLLETHLAYRYSFKFSRMCQANCYCLIEYCQSIGWKFYGLHRIGRYNSLDVQLNRSFQSNIILWPLTFLRMHGYYYIVETVSSVLFLSFDVIVIHDLPRNFSVWQDVTCIKVFYGTGLQINMPIEQIPAISIEYGFAMNTKTYWCLRVIK